MPWTFYNASGQKLSSKGKVPVADLANGTDGELITWGTDAVATTVAAGTSGHVLTSGGADAVPSFQAAAGATVEAVFFTRTADAASGAVTYGGAGGTPSGAIVVARSATNASSLSIGIAEGDLTDHSVGYYAFDSTPVGSSNSSQVVFAVNAAGDAQQHGQMSAWTTTGGTITWTRVGAGEAVSGYIIWLR